MDVFSCGREAASASRLAPLAARTGGVFVVEEDFGDAFARNLASAAARPTPRDATLTIRASKGVRVAQLVGADSEVISAEDASRVDGAAGRGESSPAVAAFALRGADGCDSVRFRFRFRFRFWFRFRFPAVRPRRLTSPQPQRSRASEASGRTALRDPRPASPAESSPRSRARHGFARSPQSGLERRFRCFFCARLTSSSPEHHGLRVKRPRQNDPSRAFHRKPRVAHVRRRAVS